MDETRGGLHSRGYLPHLDRGETIQMLTFRLAGSLPVSLLGEWRAAGRHLLPGRRETAERRLVEAYLDQGHGPRWLADPGVAELVIEALRHFDGDRYRLHAWVVMPNHVHLLVTSLGGHQLPDLVASWKKITARRANERLGRTGPFWQRKYYDRYIRSDRHLADAVAYIEGNPVTAGLCADARDWPWSSAALAEESAP